MRFGQQGCHAFEPFVAKLSHSSAFCAEQVLMMRYTARRFVAFESFAEIALDDETTAHQHFNCTIDRGGAGIRALRTKLLGNILGGEMSIGAEDGVSNCKALRGDRQVVVTQIVAERIATLVSRVQRSGCPVGVVAHESVGEAVGVAVTVQLGARYEAHALFVPQ